MAEFTKLLLLFKLSNKLVHNPLLSHGMVVSDLHVQLDELRLACHTSKSRLQVKQYNESIAECLIALEVASAKRAKCEAKVVRSHSLPTIHSPYALYTLWLTC